MLQSRNSTAAKYMCMSEVHLLKIPLSLSKLIQQLTSPPAEFSTPKNEQPVKTPDNSPRSHIYIAQSYFFLYAHFILFPLPLPLKSSKSYIT